MLHAFLTIVLVAIPLIVASEEKDKTEESIHNQIQTDQLKYWYDQKKTMIVLDARSEEYFDGTLLPHAIWLPSESNEKEINAIIPSKNHLIVVYCFGVDCPASGWLYDKLITLGYTNLYEYHEGLEGWMDKGFPTTHQ